MSVKLTLFVAAQSSASTLALQHLQNAIDRAPPGQFELEVVEVFAEPKRALTARVLVTPTLLIEDQAARYVGDLGDPDLLDYVLQSFVAGGS